MCVCVCVCVCVCMIFFTYSIAWMLICDLALSTGTVEYTNCFSAEG